MPESRKKMKREKSSKIRTLPTSPLHAVLDELPNIGITFLIIVLNRRAVISKRKRMVDADLSSGKKKGSPRRKSKAEAESTLPAAGPGQPRRGQAKAFFHEVKTSRKEMSFRRQPRTGPNSRMGNIKPLPQNLHRRGSSSDWVICLNQSRNFNFTIAGNSKGKPKMRRACWSLVRQEE